MPKAPSGNVIRVKSSEFDRNPRKYIRLSSVKRRVLVINDRTGELSAAFGGSLNVPVEFDPSPARG